VDADSDTGSDRSTRASSVNLGPALRRAWLGYQRRLDAAMADAGFGERKFPDGRVLRLCAPPSGSTISAIGRELGITRQGASKVVARLRAGDYVVVSDSPTSAREKSVVLTSRGTDYLRAQRTAARAIEAELVADLGDAAFVGLLVLLDALDSGENPRLRTYLQRSLPHGEGGHS
jgi:DNA-binding MarR family transcriptional regulator